MCCWRFRLRAIRPTSLPQLKLAYERDMRVVALTGKDGGQIAHILQDQDILLNVAHQRTARIQEIHILLIHAICDGIDQLLMGNV